MLRLVSVEPGLTEVKTYLHECGYEVIDMDGCVRPVEAVVYNGLVSAAKTDAYPAAANTVLINACGLTPEEVERQLDGRLG